MELSFTTGPLVLTTDEQMTILHTDSHNQGLVCILATQMVLQGCEEQWQQGRFAAIQPQTVAIEVWGQLLNPDEQLEEVGLFEDTTQCLHAQLLYLLKMVQFVRAS